MASPSLKQRAFVKEYLKHGNGQEAALKTYDTNSKQSAAVIASTNLRSEKVQEYMEKLLDEEGITDRHIVRNLKKIIEAGATEKALKKAEPRDALRGLDMALKLSDRYPAEKRQVEQRSFAVNLELEGKTNGELIAVLDNINEEAKSFKEMLKKLPPGDNDK